MFMYSLKCIKVCILFYLNYSFYLRLRNHPIFLSSSK